MIKLKDLINEATYVQGHYNNKFRPVADRVFEGLIYSIKESPDIRRDTNEAPKAKQAVKDIKKLQAKLYTDLKFAIGPVKDLLNGA